MSIKGAHNSRIDSARAHRKSDTEAMTGYTVPEEEKKLGAGLESSILSQSITSKNPMFLMRYLGENDFTSEINKKVYSFIIAFFKKYNQTPNLSSVQSKFPRFVFKEKTSSAVYLIDQLHERNKKSRMLWMLKKSAHKLVDESVNFSEVADDLITRTRALQEIQMKANTSVDLNKNMKEFWEDYKTLATTDGITGIPTKLDHLDQITLGLKKRELISILAFTGEGKTYLSLLIAMNVWKQNYNVLFLSLEMSKEEVARRMYAISAGVSVGAYLKGKLSKEQMVMLKESLIALKSKENHFIIDDDPMLSIPILESKIMEHKPDLVAIDYAGLMQGDKVEKDSHRRYSQMIRDIKRTCALFDIPIILNVQSTREVGKQQSPPELHQIAEGMPLSRTADVILSFIRLGGDYFIRVIKNRNNVEECTDFKISWHITKDRILKASTSDWKRGQLRERIQQEAEKRDSAKASLAPKSDEKSVRTEGHLLNTNYDTKDIGSSEDSSEV